MYGARNNNGLEWVYSACWHTAVLRVQLSRLGDYMEHQNFFTMQRNDVIVYLRILR